MEIFKEPIKQGMLLRLRGRFDTLAAKEFEEQMMAAIDEGAEVLVIDCGEMNYMSSSILRVFLMALKRIRQNTGKIILSGLQEHIKEVFDISGFLDLFETYKNREDALAAI